MKEILKHFERPFMCTEGIILDKNMKHIIDIRGFGYLSNKYGEEKACEIHDKIGEEIISMLNEYERQDDE